jgi:hypothetical protein
MRKMRLTTGSLMMGMGSLIMRMGRCMMQMRKAGGSVLSEESNVENLGELQMDTLDSKYKYNSFVSFDMKQ